MQQVLSGIIDLKDNIVMVKTSKSFVKVINYTVTRLARHVKRMPIQMKNTLKEDLKLPISISLSNLPGRLSAGSIVSGLLVAAITTSPSILLMPSIEVNKVATIL